MESTWAVSDTVHCALCSQPKQEGQLWDWGRRTKERSFVNVFISPWHRMCDQVPFSVRCTEEVISSWCWSDLSHWSALKRLPGDSVPPQHPLITMLMVPNILQKLCYASVLNCYLFFSKTGYLVTPDLSLYKSRFGDIFSVKWHISDYYWYFFMDKLLLSVALRKMTFQDVQRAKLIDGRRQTPLKNWLKNYEVFMPVLFSRNYCILTVFLTESLSWSKCSIKSTCHCDNL